MARYLIQGNYVGDGVKGLIKEGAASRVAAIQKLAESVGGSIESIYYAFGTTDVYVIADFPDNAAATAASLVTNASGAVNVGTVVLMTPAEMDDAINQTPSYRPPGA